MSGLSLLLNICHCKEGGSFRLERGGGSVFMQRGKEAMEEERSELQSNKGKWWISFDGGRAVLSREWVLKEAGSKAVLTLSSGSRSLCPGPAPCLRVLFWLSSGSTPSHRAKTSLGQEDASHGLLLMPAWSWAISPRPGKALSWARAYVGVLLRSVIKVASISGVYVSRTERWLWDFVFRGCGWTCRLAVQKYIQKAAWSPGWSWEWRAEPGRLGVKAGSLGLLSSSCQISLQNMEESPFPAFLLDLLNHYVSV